MNDLSLVVEEVDLLIAEAAWLNERGPHFVIVHAWRTPGTICAAREAVAAALFMSRGREFHLDLGVGSLIQLDFMARNRLPRTASQLAAAINADAFCAQHGANAPTCRKQTQRSFTHGAVKVYAERIRQAMASTFREAGVDLDPFLVLTSGPAGYRLKATVDWIHLVDQRSVGFDRSRDEDFGSPSKRTPGIR